MTMAEFASNYWPIIAGLGGAFVIGLIWFVRLEGRVNAVEAAQKDTKEDTVKHIDKVWEKFDAVQNRMDSVLLSMGRIEGKLDVKK